MADANVQPRNPVKVKATICRPALEWKMGFRAQKSLVVAAAAFGKTLESWTGHVVRSFRTSSAEFNAI